MPTNLTAHATVDIKAPASAVWEALTNPEIIKKYLFGTETKTDWRPGSPITFSGEWEGKPYQDKGKILSVEKEKLLSYSYWSSFSSLSDSPENYNDVTFQMQPADGVITLSVTQTNCHSEASRVHSEKNWEMVLNNIKNIVEEKQCLR